MNKNVCCTCKVVVLLIKPIVFLTFLLSSASLDLKVPNDDDGGGGGGGDDDDDEKLMRSKLTSLRYSITEHRLFG